MGDRLGFMPVGTEALKKTYFYLDNIFYSSHSSLSEK